MSNELLPRTDAELSELDQIELTHRRLSNANPIVAAQFYDRNSRIIDEARTRQAQGRAALLPETPLQRAFGMRAIQPRTR